MFLNKARLMKLKEKGNIKALCRVLMRYKNEEIWMEAVDYLIDFGNEVEWAQLFCKLTMEKQYYCINILIHRLAIPEYKKNSLNIVKQIGGAAVPAVTDTFYQHVTAIKTIKDFEKVQNWIEQLLGIIIYFNPPEATNLFIDIYEKSSNQDVKYTLLESLGQLGNEQATEFIMTQLSSESVDTRIAAIKALGLTKNPKFVSVIFDELQNNINNSFYVKSCLRALIDIGDMKSIEILKGYLHKDIDYGLREQIVKALLKSPYIEMQDVEAWFQNDVSYEVKGIIIKEIVLENHRKRISEYIIEYVTKMCFDVYAKGDDIYIWGIRLLQVKEKDSLRYLASLFLKEGYKDLKSLDDIIIEFKEKAFPYLKAVYPLIDTYEQKTKIIRLMALGNNYKLTRFFIENIDDIYCMFSIFITQKDEERILELIQIMGNTLENSYNERKAKALHPIAMLILTKCLEADYRDEERFFIKILYHFYKHFFFEEVENYFIDYLNGDSSFWKYAVRALESHKTERAKDVLEQYEREKLNNFEII